MPIRAVLHCRLYRTTRMLGSLEDPAARLRNSEIALDTAPCTSFALSLSVFRQEPMQS
ncbi:hypothetical protein [Bradyrhizobium icense]|uniref:hypothetical protein n=1 Tax=Bradyrhizobium icense TaxID=1274631 RepID=UPI0012EA91AD|nr:hypothetical protein [Bradyrhizobium icense]